MKRAFTLIELLVVISIISLLSSVVFSSLQSARTNANDIARLQTVTTIIRSLEMHYAINGNYPSPVNPNAVVCAGNFESNGCGYNGGFNEDSNVNAAMNVFLPLINYSQPITFTGNDTNQYTWENVTYNCTDPTCTNYRILYMLEELTNCGIGERSNPEQSLDTVSCFYVST